MPEPLWFRLEMDDRDCDADEKSVFIDAVKSDNYGSMGFATLECGYNLQIASKPTVVTDGPITTIEFQAIVRD